MKKILLIFTLLFALTVNAQHLSFMNIPLDGNINNFTAKLKNKGLKISPYNNSIPVGARAFTGTFIGKQASVYVYYNTKNNNVYRAKACIENTSLDGTKNLMTEVRDMLSEKYDSYCEEGTENNYTSYYLYIFNNQEIIGIIDLYITKEEGLYSWDNDIYVLHIDYTDRENGNKNDTIKMDDL